MTRPFEDTRLPGTVKCENSNPSRSSKLANSWQTPANNYGRLFEICTELSSRSDQTTGFRNKPRLIKKKNSVKDDQDYSN